MQRAAWTQYQFSYEANAFRRLPFHSIIYQQIAIIFVNIRMDEFNVSVNSRTPKYKQQVPYTNREFERVPR